MIMLLWLVFVRVGVNNSYIIDHMAVGKESYSSHIQREKDKQCPLQPSILISMVSVHQDAKVIYFFHISAAKAVFGNTPRVNQQVQFSNNFCKTLF